MIQRNLKFTIVLLCLSICCTAFSQKRNRNKKGDDEQKEKTALEELSLSGMKFRSIGPALMSGRVSDFAVHPEKAHVYYVATASGGVWKTTNNGTTFKPIFDSQGSYSIGCITMDPNNSDMIWVGTGENNNQRSVAYGDGIYKSNDGGKSWKNMGLKTSEHIGKIIVDPTNSDIIHVAAIGPLWKAGGERGVYKSIDGGENWERTLEIDEHTGVTDLIMDPRDGNILYAAAFQRRRHVYTYHGGGPESGIYKTTDGGKTWDKANNGLPSGDKGRIGLAISAADPNYIYAIVEATAGNGGFYKSTNKAAAWAKQNDLSTSGNYYQEIMTHPIDKEVVFVMDTRMKITRDGGKKFTNVGGSSKHVDDHVIWVDPANTEHWIAGCDGGIYESWDASKSWNYKANLPITQFYKVAVDHDSPVYNIYGGTQDNSTLGGPSRSLTNHGIRNSDWFITHGGDGFESQVDPNDPNIVYSQSQYGVLVRFDKKSGEEVGIQPKERKGEVAYRWNWDAPLIASPNQSGRVYFAANKVFRSDDYGNSWSVISADLTRQLNRNDLPVMGRTWSIDAVAKHRSTSPFGTIVAMAESTLNPNLLAIGTDDGLVQITENGGDNWRKIEHIPGAPNRSYVNAVYLSQHDEKSMYVVFNHHKYGDFKPYVFMSKDLGMTWTNISNNLPERGSSYAFEEDHVDKDLLFVGTEFGVFFSPNSGREWKALKSGVPTIAVRDIAIQRRENDLVLGTFGRGFYVLDDYSALRNVTEQVKKDSVVLFPVRDAWMYIEANPLGRSGKSMQGDNLYTADNLGPVVFFDYYLKSKPSTLKSKRQKAEAKAIKDKSNPLMPTYEELKAEKEEDKASYFFVIKDDKDQLVKRLFVKPSKGMNRQKWNMRFASKNAVNGKNDKNGRGSLVAPGLYSAQLFLFVGDSIRQMGTSIQFNLKAMNNSVMPAENKLAKVEFQKEVAELSRSIQAGNKLLNESNNKINHIIQAIKLIDVPASDLMIKARQVRNELKSIGIELNGDPIKTKLDIDQIPSPSGRIGSLRYEQYRSTAKPTETHRQSLEIAKEEYAPILAKLLKVVKTDLAELEDELEKVKAPYTPGRAIKMVD